VIEEALATVDAVDPSGVGDVLDADRAARDAAGRAVHARSAVGSRQ
jgi:hypothetical protein